MVLGGLAGAAVAVWNFVTPLTGVTGTFGAGLVIASRVLIVLAGILIPLGRAGGLGPHLSRFSSARRDRDRRRWLFPA